MVAFFIGDDQMARVPAVATSKPIVDTAEDKVGQDFPREMSSTGPAADSLQVARQEIVDRPVDNEQMQMLAFFNEPVTVRMATSTDKQAEQVFELNINGRLELFRRGETKTVPRYFVDRLARLKETTFTQREVVNSEGIKQMVYDPHTGLKYDFAVVRDNHPRGADWLNHTLMEA